MKSFFAVITCLAVPVAVACGGPSSEGTSNQADTTGSGAQQGESCGGFVAHPVQCAPGLVCIFKGIPDLPGTCQVDTSKVGQLGDSCGGFVAHPVQCAAGLVCVSGGVPDLPGTCQVNQSNTCGAPTDCTGFLPRNVITCGDGTTSGAHWDCISGQCVIGYCDTSSTGASDGGGGSASEGGTGSAWEGGAGGG